MYKYSVNNKLTKLVASNVFCETLNHVLISVNLPLWFNLFFFILDVFTLFDPSVGMVCRDGRWLKTIMKHTVFYIDIITDGSVKLGRREEGVHSAIRKYECDAVNV